MQIRIYISLFRQSSAGPSLADAGPGARYGVGPPSVRLQWRYGGGGGGVDYVRRGVRGPVRPHQLHRPKDGPALQCHIILQKSIQYVNLLSMLFFLAFYLSKNPEQNVTGSKKY